MYTYHYGTMSNKPILIERGDMAIVEENYRIHLSAIQFWSYVILYNIHTG